jgi:hypothetical protein
MTVANTRDELGEAIARKDRTIAIEDKDLRKRVVRFSRLRKLAKWGGVLSIVIIGLGIASLILGLFTGGMSMLFTTVPLLVTAPIVITAEVVITLLVVVILGASVFFGLSRGLDVKIKVGQVVLTFADGKKTKRKRSRSQ